ncbi:ABC transporter permease [Methylomonas sp. EbB]|uniref:ABC transporter permease n=2 Tax=Methylomonas fluvii TaxID=1854564 RepID=A0ABR9DGW2_9GAMM|nr:ABC transporter permease [Methylomonas fluvii]
MPLNTIRLSARSLLPFAGLSIALLIWWATTSPLLYPDSVAAKFAPAACLEALWTLIASAEIFPHILVSLKRVLLSLLFALLVGIPLGVLVGVSRSVERATGPLFQFVRMISPLSWMPLAVMVFGIGDVPVYFLLSVAAVWPIMLNVSAGVHAIDPRWLTLARSLCANRRETILRIIAPAIVAHIMTGIRLAIGIVWIVLVPAEMLGVSQGLGYFILDTRDRLAYSELMAVILIIGLLGYLLDLSVRLITQKWTHRRQDN